MSHNSPISIISRIVDEQIKEQQIREENRNQYLKGFSDGRFSGIREVKSKLVHLNSSHSIPKEQIEYYGEDKTAEYKEFIKKQVCNEIGMYLYENSLVAFTESDGFDNALIIRGGVQIYNDNEGEKDNEVGN